MTKKPRTMVGWLVFAASAVTILLAPSAPVLANTITFSTATASGAPFSGPVSEAGFTYSTKSGILYVDSFGNPGNDMEGYEETGGGGVLQIVSANGGDFNFNALDFSAYAYDPANVDSLTLTVTGLLGGSTVGSDSYTLATTSTFNPTYLNWTTESANTLAGQTLSQLDISITAGCNSSCWSDNIDNVVLTPLSSVPEPGTLVLLAAGLLGLGFVVRRRRLRAGPLT